LVSQGLPTGTSSLNNLTKGEDDHLHFTNSVSPEYHAPGVSGYGGFQDSNYSLALCRWLLSTLIETDEHLKIGSPDLARWKETLSAMAPFQKDENGLRISADKPLVMSHRHFSHLLALYPLFQLNPDQPADHALADKSVAFWQTIGEGKALAGYSFTGGVAIYASLGEGDHALGMLETFFSKNRLFLPNTMYVEMDGMSPVIETPLSGASVVIDLLLQSWGGKIHPFAALPTAWADADFYHLRGQGGFLVSARKSGRKTRWVAVESLAGEPCLLRVPDWNGPLTVAGSPICRISPSSPGEYLLPLAKGEGMTLFPADAPVDDFRIAGLESQKGETNAFGLKINQTTAPNRMYPERGFLNLVRPLPLIFLRERSNHETRRGSLKVLGCKFQVEVVSLLL
jgi:hypothetical protein